MNGILLTGNALYYPAMPSIGVNVAWIGISLFALGRIWLAHACQNSSLRRGDRRVIQNAPTLWLYC